MWGFFPRDRLVEAAAHSRLAPSNLLPPPTQQGGGQSPWVGNPIPLAGPPLWVGGVIPLAAFLPHLPVPSLPRGPGTVPRAAVEAAKPPASLVGCPASVVPRVGRARSPRCQFVPGRWVQRRPALPGRHLKCSPPPQLPLFRVKPGPERAQEKPRGPPRTRCGLSKGSRGGGGGKASGAPSQQLRAEARQA